MLFSCKNAPIAVCAHASKYSRLHLEGKRAPLRVETPKAITQKDGNYCHGLVLSQCMTLFFPTCVALGPSLRTAKERQRTPKTKQIDRDEHGKQNQRPPGTP